MGEGTVLVKISNSLKYKIPLQFSDDNEEGIIAMKKAVQENSQIYCEVELTESRYDILEFFEGSRIVQLYSEKSHIIVEDNELQLSLKMLTPQINIPGGTFFLNQILPRSDKIAKLEYGMISKDGPLFIRENEKVVIIVSPYIGASEIKSPPIGEFTVSEEEGVVIWSPATATG
tara:strand:+ start:7743 stop:8264 length:522 start_codon:yes stop_codon:yes gene_type:complete